MKTNNQNGSSSLQLDLCLILCTFTHLLTSMRGRVRELGDKVDVALKDIDIILSELEEGQVLVV